MWADILRAHLLSSPKPSKTHPLLLPTSRSRRARRMQRGGEQQDLLAGGEAATRAAQRAYAQEAAHPAEALQKNVRRAQSARPPAPLSSEPDAARPGPPRGPEASLRASRSGCKASSRRSTSSWGASTGRRCRCSGGWRWASSPRSGGCPGCPRHTSASTQCSGATRPSTGRTTSDVRSAPAPIAAAPPPLTRPPPVRPTSRGGETLPPREGERSGREKERAAGHPSLRPPLSARELGGCRGHARAARAQIRHHAAELRPRPRRSRCAGGRRPSRAAPLGPPTLLLPALSRRSAGQAAAGGRAARGRGAAQGPLLSAALISSPCWAWPFHPPAPHPFAPSDCEICVRLRRHARCGMRGHCVLARVNRCNEQKLEKDVMPNKPAP